MKPFTKQALILALTLLCQQIAVAAESIPAYPNSVCSQQICTSLSGSQLNIYAGNIDTSFSAVVLFNQQIIGTSNLTPDRGGNLTHIQIPESIQGEVEIYFVNNNGVYISDYGRNFRFVIP